MDDFVFWNFSLDGVFSVRSAYAMLLRNNHNVASPASSRSADWWKHFWGLHILPRFKVFIWKLVRQGLPLAATLHQRGMSIDPSCSFCHLDPETSSHLFRDCPVIAHVWTSGPLRTFCPTHSAGLFVDWCVCFVCNILSSPLHNALLDLLGSILWSIWGIRNGIRFRNAVWDPGALSVMVQGWESRCMAAQLLRRPILSPHLRKDPIPLKSPAWSSSLISVQDMGFDVCILFDGAWDASSNNAGIGWIIQDPSSLLCIGGGAQACILGSALQAELSACLGAIKMALHKGFSRLMLCSDCAVLVCLLSRDDIAPVAVSWMVQEIRELLRLLSKVSIRKVSRRLIASAHDLATSARERKLLSYRF